MCETTRSSTAYLHSSIQLGETLLNEKLPQITHRVDILDMMCEPDSTGGRPNLGWLPALSSGAYCARNVLFWILTLDHSDVGWSFGAESSVNKKKWMILKSPAAARHIA